MSSDIERWEPPNDATAFESLCLDLWKDNSLLDSSPWRRIEGAGPGQNNPFVLLSLLPLSPAPQVLHRYI
jgi:hypothetical protein